MVIFQNFSFILRERNICCCNEWYSASSSVFAGYFSGHAKQLSTTQPKCFIYLFILTRYHCHTVFIVCREVNSTSQPLWKGKGCEVKRIFIFPLSDHPWCVYMLDEGDMGSGKQTAVLHYFRCIFVEKMLQYTCLTYCRLCT